MNNNNVETSLTWRSLPVLAIKERIEIKHHWPSLEQIMPQETKESEIGILQPSLGTIFILYI